MITESLQVSAYIQFVSSFLGAFFAFVFFIIGQKWFTAYQDRKNAIVNIGRLREFILMQSFYYEFNLSTCENLIKNKTLHSINLHRLTLFPVEKYFFHKLDRYQVTSSLIYYVVNLKVLNENTRILNEFLNELTNLYRTAKFEQQEDVFENTLAENVEEFKKQSKKYIDNLKNNQNRETRIIAELNLTQDYLEGNIFQRWYFVIKTHFDKDYSEKKIKKMMNNKK